VSPTAPEADEDHPIVDRVLALLEVTVDGTYEVPEGRQAELIAAVDEHLTSRELPEVLDAILRLAHVLEVEAGSAEAAASLCAAIERDVVLRSLRQSDRTDASDSGQAFRSFSQAEPRRLPKEGEVAAEGTVKLDAFKAPRRV
jgi:hypothetical protein